MGKLADKAYWDGVYESRSRTRRDRVSYGGLGQDTLAGAILRPYADYLLWDVVYRKYLPKRPGAKVIEVGSAPGHSLVRFHQTFGYTPYGVDYSDTGAEVNQQIFAHHGLPVENVIHADFLSEEFHAKYKGLFDVVVSAGFIEHFDDPSPIVDRHLSLLAPGGYLIISIPNLRGCNYGLQRFFDKRLLPMHNLDIMQKEVFARLFERDGLTTQFCDYLGTFNLGLFRARTRTPQWLLLAFGKLLQLLLNPAFRLLFGRRGCESRTFSPYLLFIGVKKPAVSA